MTEKQPLKPIRKFLENIAQAVGSTSIARRIFDLVANSHIAKINRQNDAARRGILDGMYPPSPGGRPLDPRYTWDDGTDGHKFPSPKAQAYFFGVVLPSGNVPYERTHNLMNSMYGYVADVSENGYALGITFDENKAPYAQYVFGPQQWYYHKKTGWPTLSETLEGALEKDTDGWTTTYTDYLFGFIAGEAVRNAKK